MFHYFELQYLKVTTKPPLAFIVFVTQKEKKEICIKETKEDYQIRLHS